MKVLFCHFWPLLFLLPSLSLSEIAIKIPLAIYWLRVRETRTACDFDVVDYPCLMPAGFVKRPVVLWVNRGSFWVTRFYMAVATGREI